MTRLPFMRAPITFLVTIFVGSGLYCGLAAAVYAARKIRALDPSNYPVLTPEWGKAPPKGCRLLIVGDSRVSRWPLKASPGWSVGKVGIAGATANGVGGQARELISRVRPTVVVIQLGVNDATAAALQAKPGGTKTLRGAVAALKQLAETAQSAGSAAVIMTVPGSIRAPFLERIWFDAERQTMVQKLNTAIRRLPTEIRVQVLDADRLLRNPRGELDERYREGSLHWTAAAYDRLNHAMFSILPPHGRC